MTRLEPTELDVDDLPAGVQYLGVDGDGEQHYATTPVGGLSIYVTDTHYDYVAQEFDHERLLRFDLEDGLDLHDWLAQVSDERGAWQTLNYEPVTAETARQRRCA
jgi:hypothetical protein